MIGPADRGEKRLPPRARPHGLVQRHAVDDVRIGGDRQNNEPARRQVRIDIREHRRQVGLGDVLHDLPQRDHAEPQRRRAGAVQAKRFGDVGGEQELRNRQPFGAQPVRRVIAALDADRQAALLDEAPHRAAAGTAEVQHRQFAVQQRRQPRVEALVARIVARRPPGLHVVRRRRGDGMLGRHADRAEALAQALPLHAQQRLLEHGQSLRVLGQRVQDVGVPRRRRRGLLL